MIVTNSDLRQTAADRPKEFSAMANCPKCDGLMVQGFIVDRSHGGEIRVSSWVEGAPKKAFWVGTAAPKEKQIPIGTFRCSGCGFLESFASAELGAT